MPVQLDFRPRLADMRLARPAGASPHEASLPESRARPPRVTQGATFAGRDGYTAGFLGEFVVPWPRPRGRRAHDVTPVPDTNDNLLRYTNFSVMMSSSRRIALCVGVNISGAESVKIERGDDQWFFDGRLPVEAQIGEDLYADNLLDRGHLVRREDPNWGGAAETANADTFHFTNCTPQMAAFNQRTWLSLEDYVLKNTRRWQERVTVFSGPVFGDNDLVYREVPIPSAYWKVVAFLRDDGRPSATAYMIEQTGELSSLEVGFGAFKTYQRSISRIEALTDLDFGALSRYDGFSNEERATGTRIEAVIRDAGDLRY